MTAGQAGIFGMSITPFDAAGKLDEGALRAHLRYMAAAGVGVYLASQGTGEGHLLTREETRRVYEIGVAELKGKVPVYATGLGFTNTETVIELAQEAGATGVDALVIVPPAPSRTIQPTPEEIETYLAEILDAVDTPVFLYNHPGVTGFRVPMEIFDRLLDRYPSPKVAGVHCTDLDVNYLTRLIELVGGRAPVHVGHTAQILTNLMLGGAGALGYEANIAPRLSQSIYTEFAAGNYPRAFGAFTRVLRLNVVLAKYHNPRAIKAAVNLLGLPGGHLRKPYLPLSAAAEREIAETLERLEIRKNEGI
jgi:4-hydroxy-tetrahydrodipicolinate synthase